MSEKLLAALEALARHGVEPDIQELLVHGNPSRGIPPGALEAAIAAWNTRAPSVPTVGEVFDKALAASVKVVHEGELSLDEKALEAAARAAADNAGAFLFRQWDDEFFGEHARDYWRSQAIAAYNAGLEDAAKVADEWSGSQAFQNTIARGSDMFSINICGVLRRENKDLADAIRALKKETPRED